MESIDDVLLDSADKMEKSILFLQEQFAGLRTGKASPALVENIKVDYYGSPTRLKELANISTPEPRLIVINPFDPTSLQEIEKAILASNIGITPMNDGRIVRVPIPELSQERRGEIIKLAKKLAEETKVAIRNVRRDANEQIKSLQKQGKISEDQRDSSLEQVQKDTDTFVANADEMLTKKEAEISAV